MDSDKNNNLNLNEKITQFFSFPLVILLIIVTGFTLGYIIYIYNTIDKVRNQKYEKLSDYLI
jgi:hypothetical protein